MGTPFMPWQRQVVDVALEVTDGGEWAYDEIVVTCPRQAGKTTILQPTIAHRCGSGPKRRAWITGQTRENARKRWMDATDQMLLSAIGADITRHTSRMGEQVKWHATKSTVVPFSPDGAGLHGEYADLVTVDELWYFDAEAARQLMAAYVPTFTTRNGQAWLMSTAGTSASWWLHELRRRGREAVEADVDRGIAYFEWSLPDEVDGIDLDELDTDTLVEACIDMHPANGYTLRPASIRSAARSMDRAEFVRAYANRAADDTADGWVGIDEAVFIGQSTVETIPADADIGLAFELDPDTRAAAVVAGWRSPAGHMRTEILPFDGDGPVADYVKRVVDRWKPVAVAVRSDGAGRDVADALQRDGVDLLWVRPWDYAAACVRHRDELHAGKWWHRAEPELVDAARDARWVASRDRRYWQAAPALTASALAGWAVDHPGGTEPEPGPFEIR